MSMYSYEHPTTSRLENLPTIGQILLTRGVEAGYHTDVAFYTACQIIAALYQLAKVDGSTFSKIINGERTFGDPSKPKKLVTIAVVLMIGKNGRRAIKNEGELLSFLNSIMRLPGTELVNETGKDYVFTEATRTVREADIVWGIEDSEARLREDARKVAPHILEAITFYDDLDERNDVITIGHERARAILLEELRKEVLRKQRGPES